MNLANGLSCYEKDSADWKLTQDIEMAAQDLLSLIRRYRHEPTPAALDSAQALLIDIEKWKAMCLGDRMGNAVRNSPRMVWEAFRGAMDASSDREALLSIMGLKGFGSSEDEDTGHRRAKVATSVLRFLKPVEWGVVDWRTIALLTLMDNNSGNVDHALRQAKGIKAAELRSLFDIIDEKQACSINEKYRDMRGAPPLSRAADVEMALFGLSLVAWPMPESSTSESTAYLYDESNTIAELDAGGALIGLFAEGEGLDEPLADLRGGTAGYYDQDGLGSVTSIAGTAGTILNSVTYDSFGNITASTGSFGDPFQYTGRDFDRETGLRYYRTRYYDSNIGRFLREDPVYIWSRTHNELNGYVYAQNRPTTLVDPLGTQSSQQSKDIWEKIWESKYGPRPDTSHDVDDLIDWLNLPYGPGCYLKCIVWGFSDDVGTVALGTLSKSVRTWLATPAGKAASKAAGGCGLALAGMYCKYKCDFPPAKQPRRHTHHGWFGNTHGG